MNDADFLSGQIDAFNVAQTGVPFGGDFTFTVKDGADLVAGITGYVWGACCQVSFLWVREDLRGGGHGSRLLAQAESLARERGCVQMALETFSFQAPEFYKKKGYVVAGAIENYPGPGSSKYFLKKSLSYRA